MIFLLNLLYFPALRISLLLAIRILKMGEKDNFTFCLFRYPMTGRFLGSNERKNLGVPHGDIAIWYSSKTEKTVGLEAKMQALSNWIR